MLQQSNKLNVLRNSVELLTDDVTALYCRLSQDDECSFWYKGRLL